LFTSLRTGIKEKFNKRIGCIGLIIIFSQINNHPDLTVMDLIRIIRDKIMEERLMLVYRGVITADNSIPLLMLLEKEMEDSEFGFLGRKRVFLFVLERLHCSYRECC